MIEYGSHTPPEIAVADAMFYTRGVFEAKTKLLKSPIARYMHQESLLERTSDGACEKGSVIAINFLQNEHRDQFDRLMLIKGYSPFTFNENHAWHAYFLAHDRSSNIWYAGSPANHKAHRTGSPFDTLIASRELEAVLNGISEKDGGKWPMAAEVLASLADYQSPEFNINDANELEGNIFTFDYGLEVFDPESINSPEGLLLTHPPFKMFYYVLDSSYQTRISD